MADDRRTEVEAGAQRGLEEKGGAGLARELLRTEEVAVLATVSASRRGHPFTSLVPFAVSRGGEPLLLLSALAQHTRNVGADARASLLVYDAAAAAKDPRTAARASFLGAVRRLSGPEEA